MVPLAVVAATGLGPVLGAGTAGAVPAGGSSLATDQAKAAQLEQEIQSTGQEIDALSQQYDAAEVHKTAIDQEITATQAQIDQTKSRITRDKAVLAKAAVQAYVTGGTSANQDPLFSGSQTAAVSSTVYHKVVAGNLNQAMDDLNAAVTRLDSEEQTLNSEDAQAAQAVAAAQAANNQAQALQAQQQAELNQVKGQIATLVAQQQAAEAAAQQRAAQAQLAADQSVRWSGPLPPASGGAGAAVAAAESQLGVPYRRGAEDPGVAFDCSGLTAWAWGQAGVPLPHYSGSQMADTTPVPVSDLQPGDLLFYGPGGGTHVAMYVGGGRMIEATEPGQTVRIDPVRLGTGFAGAGRP